MHPFYGPNARLTSGRAAGRAGLISMAAYLAFWAAALVVAKRELDLRWPRRPHDNGGAVGSGAAMDVLRERFARGEVDEAQFRAMAAVLDEGLAGRP